MAYLGNTPTQQGFIPAIDFFSGNGATVAFTLSRPVASVAQVQATIENVPQNPGDAFTVSGNTITFTSAPPSGTNNIYVYYTSPITQVVALPQSPQVFGNLQFSSPGARITGDMSNATQANRVVFQTSTTNGNSVVGVLPNGTATTSVFRAFNNSDPTNSSEISLFAASADVRVISGITGTGSYLPMTFYTGNSESLRLSATAKTLILAGGSTSANGTGITFPATQSASSDANTLDDYEEGTFTPTLYGASVAGTLTGGDRYGVYTKIGNTVNFWIRFSNVNLSGASGGISIGNLPFSRGGASDLDPPYIPMLYNFAFNTSAIQNIYLRGTVLNGLESFNGGAWVTWNITNSSNLYLGICGSYSV
jgi:hypothetical protein